MKTSEETKKEKKAVPPGKPFVYVIMAAVLIMVLLIAGKKENTPIRNFVPVPVPATADDENNVSLGQTESDPETVSRTEAERPLVATSGNAAPNDVQDVESKEATEWWQRYVYLTFDDGPSENTDYVLEVLRKHNIKATFFVVGHDSELSAERCRQIVEEGHTLAMHSYTHDYNLIYSDIEAFKADFYRISDLLTQETGIRPVVYRFPGGSSNSAAQEGLTEYKNFLEEQGVVYFDWNVSSGDGRNGITAEEIVNNVISTVSGRTNSVVLMHDSAYKTSTMEALETVIQELEAMEVEFLPITAETTPVQHR